MKTIDNIRWQLDQPAELAPRTAAAVIVALALACWALVIAVLVSAL